MFNLLTLLYENMFKKHFVVGFFVEKICISTMQAKTYVHKYNVQVLSGI